MKKKEKQLEVKEKKQIDPIANRNERLATLTNKDDHKINYKEIFEKIVKERFDEIKELTDKTNQNDLIYYFKANTVRKKIDNFNNGI